ncbi:hypothetical protein WMF31_15520 [Sorangium sp. So ce1036]|uniref:hypothetical protein n=1 Tax=Sorangium sp. So ce1036 TaxID=3133328 RepID=UPI003EFCECFD
MNSVFQLLTDLSIDPFRLDEFLSDPAPMFASRGIRPEDISSIMRPAGIAPGGTWHRGAAFADPGYDPLPDPDVPDSPEQEMV